MNKVAIIAGGSSGIGYSTAEVFLEHSYSVVISGRNKEKLYTAHQQLKTKYPEAKIMCYPADMSSFIDVQLLCEYTMTNFGAIHILVNSCGSWSSKPLSELSDKDIQEAFDSNLKSVIVGSVVAQQFMNTNTPYNYIINLGSFAGIIPRRQSSLYSCFKSAIINFTKSSASELIEYGIKVNCITPGLIDTPMTHDNIMEHETELLKNISMKRVGRPEEIAKTIYWLTTSDSSYINGANIVISGGKYLTQSE